MPLIFLFLHLSIAGFLLVLQAYFFAILFVFVGIGGLIYLIPSGKNRRQRIGASTREIMALSLHTTRSLVIKGASFLALLALYGSITLIFWGWLGRESGLGLFFCFLLLVSLGASVRSIRSSYFLFFERHFLVSSLCVALWYWLSTWDIYSLRSLVAVTHVALFALFLTQHKKSLPVHQITFVFSASLFVLFEILLRTRVSFLSWGSFIALIFLVALFEMTSRLAWLKQVSDGVKTLSLSLIGILLVCVIWAAFFQWLSLAYFLTLLLGSLVLFSAHHRLYHPISLILWMLGWYSLLLFILFPLPSGSFKIFDLALVFSPSFLLAISIWRNIISYRADLPILIVALVLTTLLGIGIAIFGFGFTSLFAFAFYLLMISLFASSVVGSLRR